VAGLAIATCSFVALTSEALNGVRSTTNLSTQKQVNAWELDSRYWDCLETQAHSLVRPGERIWMDTTNLVYQVTLERIMANWTEFTSSARSAQAFVTIRPDKKQGSCLGSVVEGLFDGPRGPGTLVRLGTGGSVPGSTTELPETPL